MQQTALDHWLQKKFSHVTRFYCNVLPEGIPNDIGVEEAPEGEASSHRFRITAMNDAKSDQVVDLLRVQGITYQAQIDERSGGASRLVSRPRRSLTYDVAWVMIIVVAIGIGGFFLVSTGTAQKLYAFAAQLVTS